MWAIWSSSGSENPGSPQPQAHEGITAIANGTRISRMDTDSIACIADKTQRRRVAEPSQLKVGGEYLEGSLTSVVAVFRQHWR